MGADSITIIVSSSYTFDPLCIKGWMLRIKNGYNMNERYTYIYKTIGKRRKDIPSFGLPEWRRIKWREW